MEQKQSPEQAPPPPVWCFGPAPDLWRSKGGAVCERSFGAVDDGRRGGMDIRGLTLIESHFKSNGGFSLLKGIPS